MKFTKKMTAALLTAAILIAAAGCQSGQKKDETTTTAAPKVAISIATLKGPTGMGMVKLMKNNEDGAAANNYTFAVESDPTVIGPMLIKGDVDIAACPLNMAAALYNKTKATAETKDDVQLLAINTLGVLYVVENGSAVTGISDLKGKTIFASGQGATPEYILNYILTSNGFDPNKDVTIEYKAEHSELATLAVSGQAAICVLPEPFVTTVLSKNKDLRVALDLTQEWDKIGKAAGKETTLAMGALVVRTDFAKQNPAAIQAFMQEYKASVDFVNANRDEAAALIAEKEIIPSLELAKSAIPRSSLTFISSTEMKTIALQNFQVLFDANKVSVGGAIPPDEFFYNAQN